ncbi:hypothetical protein J0895_12810 [Phormidium pseudopriestleyi FRX01]|uniref:Uncharacterized protein n=1 Tax=Phormidium pseudopriestleyi FRX01 TaxID=1759528 RepID=A0ABS3FTP4_9CYAN|nr:hypothetical protein [Phormidium pseudopriestleyi]MBO0349976.1 hypothetical protein [Phormidium pseudopriestleyi FRX01]
MTKPYWVKEKKAIASDYAVSRTGRSPCCGGIPSSRRLWDLNVSHPKMNLPLN